MPVKVQAERRGPGSIDCVQRGLRSLRANWELVPLVVAQSLLTGALVLAGLFVLLTALGVGVVGWLREAGPDWPQRLSAALTDGLAASPPALATLLVPLAAATLVWTLAFLLYCYFQGGVMGILDQGERRAGGGLPGWAAFRSFSLAGFDRQGRRLFWRYFWLNHLLGGVLLAWTLLALGLATGAVVLAGGESPAAGVLLGCIGLLPLALLAAAATIWSGLATVDLARPEAGVWAASRRALATLRRRPGAVLLVWLLAFCAWLAVGATFAPLAWGLGFVAGDQWLAWLSARGLLAVAEALVNGALLVALLAALAALLAGGRRDAASGTA